MCCRFRCQLSGSTWPRRYTVSSPFGHEVTFNQIRTKSVNTGFGRSKEVVEERKCPTPLASPLSQKLERLLNVNEGGDKGSPFDFANILQQKLVELLRSAPSTRDFTSENEEMWFNKLRKDPAARTKLENIHLARAFK